MPGSSSWNKNKKYDYKMCGVKLKRTKCAEDLCVRIASNFKFSQPGNDATKKVNKMLGVIKRNFSFENKDVILTLFNSLVRPHLEYIVQIFRKTLLI